MKNHDFNYDELELILTRRGMEWSDLARKVEGVAERTVYSAKARKASRSTMKAIARALRVSIDRLIIETTEENTK